MRLCNGFFSRPMPPGLLFALMSDSDLWKFERVLANRAAVLQLLDVILLPVKAGAETDAIFASGVPSPLDNERRTITSLIRT